MSGLGEQIAVLDGLAALDPNDGRIGQRRASVTQGSTRVMPGVLRRRGVIDASAGANYSGGSSHYQRGPLLPSSVGLASIPSVLPPQRNVIDPSGGVNYTGGSDWVPGMPLTVSSAGLAADLIRGGYGRAGLGADLIRGGYGRAGLGQTNSAVDSDLADAAEAVATARAIDPSDGRIGQNRGQVDEYGKPIMPGVLARSNVLDPSEGGNYGGGSDYYPGSPLLPSSAGLAGFNAVNLDGLSDARLFGALKNVLPAAKVALLKKAAGRNVVSKLKKKIGSAARNKSKSANARALARAKALQAAQKLARVRQIRQNIAKHGAVSANFAVRSPLWAR